MRSAVARATVFAVSVLCAEVVVAALAGSSGPPAGPAVASAAALAGCLRAARRSARPAGRQAWTLLAVACLGWAVAPAYPTARLVGLTAAAGAVLVYLGPALSGAGRLRVVFDALLAGASFAFLAWSFLPGLATPRAGAGSGAGPRLVALAHPVGDLVVVTLLLIATGRVRRASRLPWAVLTAGLVVLTLGDSFASTVHLGATLAPAALKGVLWTAGALLVLVAASCGELIDAPLESAPPQRLAGVLLPYAPAAIAGAEALSRQIEGAHDRTAVWLAATIGLLLFVRQLFAQVEYVHLAHHLDAGMRRRTAELFHQQRRFRALVQHASDVLTVIDDAAVIRYQSDAALEVLGIVPDALAGTPFLDLVHTGDVDAFRRALDEAPAPPAPPTVVETRLKRRLRGTDPDGGFTWIVTETTISDLRADPDVAGILLTTRDVTERKRLEERLRHDALHDPLTGLGNRLLFHERLTHAVERAGRNPDTVGVLMIDLDGFKAVNDTLGHGAGDRLLVEVARRLRSSVRPGDTVARMGGDEFAVLVERAEPETAERIAQRVLGRLRAPIDLLDGKPIVPSCSVGVATALTSRMTGEEIVQAADLAMYTAKTKGKGAYAVFEDSMHEVAVRRVEVEADLRRAVCNGELVVQYQPIVELPSGRITGAEALVRWQHPTRGLVPPSEFIPIAEDTDLIFDIGRQVLTEACRAAAGWQAAFPEDARFDVSVNVAARQLTHPWFLSHVARALADTGCDPAGIVLEITEGALMADACSAEPTLRELRALGVRLAIDDFGTGWSSLSRLRDFPVDKLKIDRAFVREITSPTDDVPLVAAIVAMAKSLGLAVVAEGVETLDQLAALHGLGCDEVQGYLLSRPLAAGDLEALVADPIGLLDGPSAAMSAQRRSLEERELMGMVASATTAPSPDSALVATMLEELRRVAGLDSVFLTAYHEGRRAQEVKVTANGPRLVVPRGMVMPWTSSPCAQMLAGGPKVTADLRVEHPSYALTAIGVAGHVTVPVRGPSGEVYGTLCGASTEPLTVGAGTVVLFELFASLVAEHGRAARAARALEPIGA